MKSLSDMQWKMQWKYVMEEIVSGQNLKDTETRVVSIKEAGN